VVLGTWLLSGTCCPTSRAGWRYLPREPADDEHHAGVQQPLLGAGDRGIVFASTTRLRRRLVEQLGALLQNETAINIGVLSSLIRQRGLWKRAALK